MKYNFRKIERVWQAAWEKSEIYQAKDNTAKKKWYSLIEFPYPSGAGLHAGHIRSNTAMDIISRKRRMEGYNVLYPIGWDAFGLPTENYAIKTGIAPQIATRKNSDTFRRQLKSLGFSFDWSREINTTDPDYYKWTQWMFLKFFERGLAYKTEMLINWCPKDKCGLANEEVVGGKCERCGAPVEKRNKAQWMIKITAYADKLLQGLKNLDYLPEIKAQQENWIGRSEGAEIEFRIKNLESRIKVFTTRPDTLFGATYMVLAPEHPLLVNNELRIMNKAEVNEYIKKTAKKTEMERTAENKEKTGVELKGIKAINPANEEEIPVWISDYVMASYGTGAIMAVPAHDERDFAFAKKFNLPVKQVIMPSLIDESNPPKEEKENTFRNMVLAVLYNPKKKKYLTLKWKKQPWTTFITGGVEEGENAAEAARREIAEETGYIKVRLVKNLGKTEAYFFAAHKNVNRQTHGELFLFELENDFQAEVKEKEKKQHGLQWLSLEELQAAHLQHAESDIILKKISTGVDSYAGPGILIGSGKFNGFSSEEAKKKITDFVGGKIKIAYKLRDWVFSRQRYWGEPIPIIDCQECGFVAVPEKDLPVKLPPVKNYKPRDDGESPLASVSKWVNVRCPKCKGLAKRETDTMPNWAGSSWYFLRYIDPKNKNAFADSKKLEYWMGVDPVRSSPPIGPLGVPSAGVTSNGVDWYNGGMEHVTLHLLYSRFWNHFLYDLGLVPTAEPYKKRTAHGIILAEGGVKMSKSKGNVVNPDPIVKEFGADALRLYEMFMGPFNQAIAWDKRGVLGTSRFLERVWKLYQATSDLRHATSKKNEQKDSELQKLLHKTIKKVSEDIEEMRFNTAISAMMIFINGAEKSHETFGLRERELFLRILAPFAPHIAEELWQIVNNELGIMNNGKKKVHNSIHLQPWPKYDPKFIEDETFMLIVQINGKVRDSFEVLKNISQKEAEKLALERENIRKYLGGEKPKRVVFVPGRLINIVL